MEKRVLIAIILSMGLLFLYPYILKMLHLPETSRQTQAPQTTETPKTGEAGKAISTAVPAKEAQPIQPPEKEELATVETPLFKAVFTSNGGGVKRWELKSYNTSLQKDSRLINLTETIGKGNSFKTRLSANGVTEDIVFKPSTSNIALSGSEKAELIFEATAKDGVRLQKKYVFSGDSYMVNTEFTALNSSVSPFNGSADVTLTASYMGEGGKSNYHLGPVVRTKDKLTRQTVKEPQMTGSGAINWLGLEDKYFLSALVPRSSAPVNWTTEAPSKEIARAALQIPLVLGPGQKMQFNYDSFMGPKEYDILVKQKLGLEESIEFGWFAFMAKPLLVVLNFFERYLGNYGIAIVIITVIIKILFYPLSKHSIKSMKEMQNVQPQLAAIKEKYKDNKEKQNKELMELYKRYKINPLGGCLPMVLQIPVFIALYEVLYVAIELRHAPLFLWIRDLSDKDPYYITPVIMGVTMFIQQKMTPTTVDPAQAKVMLIMPVVFTFMFLNFPSGLVIYWLVNNVLSIAQQYYIQKAPAKA